MFRGSSYHTIDAKGRIMLPPRFRDIIRLSDVEAVMVTGVDNGLAAYPFDVWRGIEAKFEALTETSVQLRRFRRMFIGNASKCALDKQGRILIPQTLRDYGGLAKETVLVGVLKHFEIWSRSRLEEQNALVDEDMQKEEVRLEIARLGL
ncbi:MAG: division/cell wall cluster transcriptional repressor MraZ [Desulfosarcinaceae bacterium]|nr:division/cell wall cluster transcriptional repressor MraZ [Desulfosarcinaceae bacterium]